MYCTTHFIRALVTPAYCRTHTEKERKKKKTRSRKPPGGVRAIPRNRCRDVRHTPANWLPEFVRPARGPSVANTRTRCMVFCWPGPNAVGLTSLDPTTPGKFRNRCIPVTESAVVCWTGLPSVSRLAHHWLVGLVGWLAGWRFPWERDHATSLVTIKKHAPATFG